MHFLTASSAFRLGRRRQEFALTVLPTPSPYYENTDISYSEIYTGSDINLSEPLLHGVVQQCGVVDSDGMLW